MICSRTSATCFTFPSRHDDASPPQHEKPCRELRRRCRRLDLTRPSGNRTPAPHDSHETKHRHATVETRTFVVLLGRTRDAEGRVIYSTSAARQYLNNNSRNYLIYAVRLHSLRNQTSIPLYSPHRIAATCSAQSDRARPILNVDAISLTRESGTSATSAKPLLLDDTTAAAGAPRLNDIRFHQLNFGLGHMAI